MESCGIMISALLRYGYFGMVLLVIALLLGQSSAADPVFVNTLGMRFVMIPSGTFMMGSHESAKAVADNAAYSDIPGKVKWHKREHPLHSVTLTDLFCSRKPRLR